MLLNLLINFLCASRYLRIAPLLLVIPLLGLTACLPDPVADELNARDASVLDDSDLDPDTRPDTPEGEDENSDERRVVYCPAVYAPVCAELVVQCVTTPCTPLQRTFSNSCEAGKMSYTIVRNGRCDDDGTDKL